MNRIIVGIAVCLFLSANVFAQGIEFAQGSWEEIKAQAKKEQKPIFLDGYASWCGPCKNMIGKVFPMEEVGDFYNSNFINVKMDLEKGEGPSIANEFEVKSYPTFLFFDMNGSLVHRTLGQKPPEDFIADGRNALDENTQLVTLENKYTAGEQDKSTLRNYALALVSSGAPGVLVQKVSGQYMDALSDKDMESKEALDFMMKTAQSPTSYAGRALLSQKDRLFELYDKEKVEGRFLYLSSMAAVQAARKGDRKSAMKASKYLEDALGDRASQFDYSIPMLYAEYTSDWATYAKESAKHVAAQKDPNWNELNSIAWNYYLHVDDEAQLKKGLGFAKKSVGIESNFYNLDTYASLYYKLGNKKKALKTAKKAVAAAKKEDMDPGETLKLIEKIKSM